MTDVLVFCTYYFTTSTQCALRRESHMRISAPFKVCFSELIVYLFVRRLFSK